MPEACASDQFAEHRTENFVGMVERLILLAVNLGNGRIGLLDADGMNETADGIEGCKLTHAHTGACL